MLVRSDETTMIHLSEISSVIADTTAIYFSAYLLKEFAKSKIPVLMCDERHNPSGQFIPLYGAHNTSKRVLEQIAWKKELADILWNQIVRMKISKQADILRINHKTEAKMLDAYAEEIVLGDKTNREGHAAKVYFNALFGKDFSRDQDNDINASLNYGYAIILSLFNKEIVSRGYLTQLGICHRNEYNQFNLSCDFMEPFRPYIDKSVVEWEPIIFDHSMRLELANIGNSEVYYKTGKYRISSAISLFTKQCIDCLDGKIDLRNIEIYKWQ